VTDSTHNSLFYAALGIRSIAFSSYDGTNRKSYWKVTTEDGQQFKVAAPNLAGESTVLKYAAARLAKMGRGVRWPE
jgi:uncharacterized iron-regulated protein